MNRTQEKELFEQTVLLSELFYGVTTTQLRKFAFSYAEKMNLNHSFNKEDRLAGKDWLEGFLKRNPGIPLRRSRKNRSTVDEKEVKMFFDNLEGAMERYKFPPDRVYNMDETGINTVQMSSRVLAEKKCFAHNCRVWYEREWFFCTTDVHLPTSEIDQRDEEKWPRWIFIPSLKNWLDR
jgi:hypothetical protein